MKSSTTWNRIQHLGDWNRFFKLLVLRGSVLVLLFWQAAGTGLHGNSDAHAAASDGHVGDARPFISLWAVTLDAGQEAVLVKTSWTDTHRHNTFNEAVNKPIRDLIVNRCVSE